MLITCDNRGRQNAAYGETPLTLAEVSPSWNDRLKQLPVSRRSLKWISWYYQMQSHEMCIVGESFGFSPSYRDGCSKCLMFSQRFPVDFKAGSYGELKKNVQRFIDHYNEKHRELYPSLQERSGTKRKLRWFDSFLRFDDHITAYR